MSSKYPILDNRPIDCWKVTELKEELKKRKLTTKGLKDDLVKRLDEALRVERENNAKDVITGVDLDSKPGDGMEDSDTVPVVTEEAEVIVNVVTANNENVGDVKVQVDINDSVEAMDQEPGESTIVVGNEVSENVASGGELSSTEVSENVASEVTLAAQDAKDSETQKDHGYSKYQINNEGSKPELENEESKSKLGIEDSKPQLADEGSKPQLADEGSKPQLADECSKPQLADEGSKLQLVAEGSKPKLGDEGSKPRLGDEDSKPQLGVESSRPQLGVESSNLQLDDEGSRIKLDDEGSKRQLDDGDSKFQLGNEDPKLDPKPQMESKSLSPPHEDIVQDSSASKNQVSEVSPNLGFQVKSDSISTDSVSINEKIELKDNIITDNVKLELDVKPEIVEPSSINVDPVDGGSHQMDVEEPQEKKTSVDQKDDTIATNADVNKKNESLDVGYSEKLNLDRSSGDDSMEEDLDIKQIDSKYNIDDVGVKSEKSESHVGKEENPVVAGNSLSVDEREMHNENRTRSAVPTEKRKLNDQDAVAIAEPLKRQRRWNTESVKVPEPQSSNLGPTTTPKNASQPALLKRNFSRSDSSVSNEGTLKERVVPPSQRSPTNSLRIDNFLRPFTLKAVQALLEKTGHVTSFWMDQIKTHCYVSYSSAEEAIETRNAVYNLQWPPNGGKLLVAEFVDPQEVKLKLEAPESPAAPITPSAFTAPSSQPQPSPRLQVSKPQLPPPPPLPPPPALSDPPLAKERLGLPPPPPLPEKHDPPIVTLDDLFRKTRATPRIYYLPLSEEQVAAKLPEQSKTVHP